MATNRFQFGLKGEGFNHSHPPESPPSPPRSTVVPAPAADAVGHFSAFALGVARVNASIPVHVGWSLTGPLSSRPPLGQAPRGGGGCLGLARAIKGVLTPGEGYCREVGGGGLHSPLAAKTSAGWITRPSFSPTSLPPPLGTDWAGSRFLGAEGRPHPPPGRATDWSCKPFSPVRGPPWPRWGTLLEGPWGGLLFGQWLLTCL